MHLEIVRKLFFRGGDQQAGRPHLHRHLKMGAAAVGGNLACISVALVLSCWSDLVGTLLSEGWVL